MSQAPLPTSLHSTSANAPLYVVIVCLFGSILAGCASSGGTTTSIDRSDQQTWSPEEAESRLRSASSRWEGVPHEWGGTSHRGVDCSGLVQSVFQNEFQLSLPRSTEKQVQAGTTVSRSELQPGDLVFFRPGWKKRHVGIYLSDGKFLHASSSEGVTVSPLDRSYWDEHWWQARRVLSVSGESTDAPSSPPEPTTSRSGGW